MKKHILTLGFLLAAFPAVAAFQPITSGTGPTHQWSVQKDRMNLNFTELYGHKVVSGSVTGNNLTLVLADASTIVVDVSTLLDNTDAQTITAFSLNATTNILTLTIAGGNTSTVDLSGLVGGGLADAPSDGSIYGRQDGAWVVMSGSGTDDQTASEVSFTPNGSIAATDVQAAIQEVRDEAGGGGYTNLTSFIAQTPWRIFYSNTDGDVTELALGADGEYLKSNGAALAPTWATPSGAAHDAVTLGTPANGLSLSTQQLSLALASTSTTGALSNTDWNTFNNKTDDQTATEVNITDTGGYFTGTEVETVLQEIGATTGALKTKQPVTLNLTTDTSISEAQLLANDYITNQGAAGEVDITLPAVSYTISRTIIVNEAQIVEVNPPSGEAFDLSGITLTADYVVDSPATVGSKLVVTRMQDASGAWHYSLDTVRGTWADSGASD